MKMDIRYRWRWAGSLLLLPLMAVLLVACSSDDEEALPRLNIYIYAPERPTVTRSGSVEALPTEAKVHNLQIWVFKSSDPSKKVASLTLQTEEELAGLNSNKSASYSIELDDRSFALNPEPVDIYVLANQIGNNGTEYKEPINDSGMLDAAVLKGGNYYAFMNASPYQAVTEKTLPEAGIPMSGVARGRSVVDQNNVLHISDAHVKLVREVSKIRFVFSSLKGENDQETSDCRLYVEGITLDKNMFYDQEYFFLNDEHPNYWVDGNLFGNPVQLYEGDLNSPVVQIKDPTQCAYTSSMTDAEYEDAVDGWVKKNEETGEPAKLTQLPVVYLPESDKKLSGTIKFKVGSNTNETKTAKFSMVGSDFRRNQTWIVYAYYIGSTKLVVNTVQVTDWDPQGPQDPHEVHNL